jgi:hypothetical protein
MIEMIRNNARPCLRNVTVDSPDAAKCTGKHGAVVDLRREIVRKTLPYLFFFFQNPPLQLHKAILLPRAEALSPLPKSPFGRGGDDRRVDLATRWQYSDTCCGELTEKHLWHTSRYACAIIPEWLFLVGLLR